MSKIGELAHIDLHQISKGITIAEPDKMYYLLGVIDDYTSSMLGIPCPTIIINGRL